MINLSDPMENVKKRQQQINKFYYDLKDAADNIFNEILACQRALDVCMNYYRKQNPYIVKSVLKYIASGYDKNSAINLTAQDFSTTPERIEAIYQPSRRYMSAVNLYAKRYMTEKLRSHGFKIKEIAAILGVSENHVYKLLKCKIDL